MLHQAFCSTAVPVSPWVSREGEKHASQRYDKPTRAFSILRWMFGWVRDRVAITEQQPTVIALHAPFHARCYATGGKKKEKTFRFPQRWMRQWIKRHEAAGFNYHQDWKELARQSAFFLCRESTLRGRLSSRARALSVKYINAYTTNVWILNADMISFSVHTSVLYL